MEEQNKGPHTAVGNPDQHREVKGKTLSPGLTRIAAKARSYRQEQFNNLLHHLTPELIRDRLSKIPYNSSTGVDKLTVGQVRENLDWLLPSVMERVYKGTYGAPPVRRVSIPKPDGRKRPIGIPTVLDRVLQASMAQILEQIYEQDFLKASFGFRPRIGCHQALATVGTLIQSQGLRYALEVDIRDFFGSLNHEWLRKFLRLRIGDERVLKLIDSWLQAGVIEGDQWQVAEEGTPQGGSISPLLANIYLHYVLDLWWEKKIRGRLKGRASLVRYADDFVILFEQEGEAEEVLNLIKARFDQFGLKVAEEKTHVTDLTPRENRGGGRRHMAFLGMKIFLARNRKNTGWKIVYQTEGKRFSRAKERIKEKMWRMMHRDLGSQVDAINSFLAGHFNYYGLPGNRQRLQALHYLVERLWRRYLGRRSQNGKVNWEKMKDLFRQFPLCRPRLKITYRDLGAYALL